MRPKRGLLFTHMPIKTVTASYLCFIKAFVPSIGSINKVIFVFGSMLISNSLNIVNDDNVFVVSEVLLVF